MNWIYEEKKVNIFSHLYLTLKEKKKYKKQRVIILSGPTAIGKSSLGIKIAKIINGEIISCDSMQIYKNMDIGTAKVSVDQRKEVVHHLIDICDVREKFSVVDYYQKAIKICKNILMRNKVPIIVGGCGFYLHSLLYGPPQGPPPNEEIREKLKKELEKLGSEVLYERLQMIDPEYADTITEKDQHKIIRALEIIYITKRTVTSFLKEKKEDNIFDFRCWFLHMDRNLLYSKVEKRCEKMVDEGLLEEVEKLKKEGLLENYSAQQSIGYRQCLDYLDKKYDEETFMGEFKKASRHYVKRQFTWFKKEKDFRWLDLHEIKEEKAIEFILQDYEQG